MAKLTLSRVTPSGIDDSVVVGPCKPHRTRRKEGEVLHENVLEVGRERSCGGVVKGRELDLGRVVLEARVGVLNVRHYAAAIISGLDADAGRVRIDGAVSGEHIAVEENIAHSCRRKAADGLAMPGKEMVVGDRHIHRGRTGTAGGADCYIVIAIGDPGPRNREVLRIDRDRCRPCCANWSA